MYLKPLSKHIFFASLLSSAMIGCGGSSESSSPNTSTVNISFSDYPVEDAAKVVITVDSISFQRDGGETIIVDTFTSSELGIAEADTFTVDLLDYQGSESVLVLDSVELPIGEYSNLRLEILDEDVNFSYVEEIDSGLVKPIKVPSDELKLGGFTIEPLSTQGFVVEFDLHQAMTYNPGPERYILKPRGVRVVAVQEAAMVSGTVDLAALHLLSPCLDKVDPSVGNVMYLYAGHDLDASLLVDLADPENPANELPEGAVLPIGAYPIAELESTYSFSFIEPGDYTLAFSCDAAGDDADLYDMISMPLPATQLNEISLTMGESLVCDFPLVEGACAVTP